MNLASLDLNLLVALEALVEEENVGRAARRIGLSQPAMSHALNRLRGMIGDPIMVRVGGRMQLTVRGESLRYPVRDALERVRDLLIGDSFLPATSERTFRVMIADNASDLLLPALLSRLQREAPNVHLEVLPLRRVGHDAADLAHDVDIAVACVPDAFPGFYRQRLFTDRDACAVRRGHPIARRLADTERFLKAKHVAVTVPGLREDPIDTWLRQEGHKRNIALTVPHYIQALLVAARSDLIAVIPERLIHAYAANLKMRAIPVPMDVGSFDEYVLHPARAHADPGCIWLRGLFKDIGKLIERTPQKALPAA
ncbi:MAG TPA: LysR family transcriptional regulator [Candidatus Angelobacter sp.]|nr:LysR family transcriptional regulator [Candidatus Angelobacter sp.]